MLFKLLEIFHNDDFECAWGQSGRPKKFLTNRF
jgi:hypothetical protein